MVKYQVCIFALVALGLVVTADGFSSRLGWLSPRSQDGGRIVGGKEVVPHSLPWQAWLHGDLFCGAVIICSRYVMTAGHCSEQDTIEVGLHSISNKTEFQTTRSRHHVKRSFRHPDYFEYPYPEYSKYDFAILELENPINFIPEVKAISLPSATDTHFDEDTVFVTSGWGRISSFEPPSNVLLSVSVPWVPQKICRENYKKQGFKVTNDMICAGDVENGQIDSCQGDSGGE